MKFFKTTAKDYWLLKPKDIGNESFQQSLIQHFQELAQNLHAANFKGI